MLVRYAPEFIHNRHRAGTRANGGGGRLLIHQGLDGGVLAHAGNTGFVIATPLGIFLAVLLDKELPGSKILQSIWY